MLIYLDSSAIVKLIRREPETRALFEFLRAWPERVSSVLSSVEVPRAVRRTSAASRTMRRVEFVLSRLALVELDALIRVRAAALESHGLRTLDAIHVATALDLGRDVAGFVTFDERQAKATRGAGMDVFSPGRP